MEEILEIPLVHGRFICNYLLKELQTLPEVKISDDVKILTVVGEGQKSGCVLKKSNLLNTEITFIEVNKYIKFISKIEGLKNYIEKNYDELPEYILYMDGFDTLIINNLDNPSKILKDYNCKMLFNATPGYYFNTGVAQNYTDTKKYNELLLDMKDSFLKKNHKKFNLSKDNNTSLNAGIFIGEKKFVLEILKEVHEYMLSDYELGFPHGSTCDQMVFKYMNNKYFDDICIDIYKKLTLWGHEKTIEKQDSIFSIGYNRIEK